MSIVTVNSLNSKISFSIRHMQFTKVTGSFGSFTANIEAASITELSYGNIEIEIDVASISTNNLARDQHLISADFFDADRYPKIYFKKSTLEATDDELQRLTGEMTIKNITRPVIFDVFHEEVATSNWGMEVHRFSCHTILNRKDFNLTYNALIEAGGAVIDENIQVIVELELNT